MTEKELLNAITAQVIGCTIPVHRELGPGMLESAYEACLAYAEPWLGHRAPACDAADIQGANLRMRLSNRLDRRGQCVVVEVKAIARFDKMHEAQLLSYMRQSGAKVGLLINFNVRWLAEDGIKRIVNGFPD